MSEQQINIKFVKEVQKYPILYNFELPSYSRRDVSDEAWKEVGKAMNMTRKTIIICSKRNAAMFVGLVDPRTPHHSPRIPLAGGVVMSMFIDIFLRKYERY